MRQLRVWAGFLSASLAFAQVPQDINLQAIKQSLMGSGGGDSGASSGVLPSAANGNPNGVNGPFQNPYQQMQDQKLDEEIKAMRAKDKGARRFASDLFDVRQPGSFTTDGGVAEDYVLGTGDQLYMNAVGSANFDFSMAVDGRGEVQVPKLGSARVGGLTLGQARREVQSLVDRNYKKTAVSLQVTQLREIRISILGEVYKPGSYLVPSLGSLVNVLSLAGGPTNAGSYRNVRVVRGGKVVYHLDLYPLRAEGLGNPNFALQSGDVIFIPVAQNVVMVEGAFNRVVKQILDLPDDLDASLDMGSHDQRREHLERQAKILQAQLGQITAGATQPAGEKEGGKEAAMALNPKAEGAAATVDLQVVAQLEARLESTRLQLAQLNDTKRGDHRLEADPLTNLPVARNEDLDEPDWLRRWELSGQAPRMSFEMLPGETLLDAVRYAGGLAPEAGDGTLSIRRRDPRGSVGAVNVLAVPEVMAKTPVKLGDVVSALPQRQNLEGMVRMDGWIRVPGVFARTQGLRVGDLLKKDSQLLPDTYRARGEIVRVHPDGTTQYLSFNVDKALAGDAADNVVLEDRDRVEFYKMDDFRLLRTVTVSGPILRPGIYDFHPGMRASDLIFRGGVPMRSANRFAAELARTRDGQPSQIIRLDLTKLLSTDSSSPTDLNDDAVNPKLEADDLISIFEQPDYHVHRVVHIQGQVQRPGDYVLDEAHATLSDLVKRAGGLTPDAMPKAGVFLRAMGTAANPFAQTEADKSSGIQNGDPTGNGINDILERLNETKRQHLSGALLKDPVFHALQLGTLSRLVVDFQAAVEGKDKSDVELQDGDQIIVPRRTDAAYVVGETASPFASYKVSAGVTVQDLLRQAGGTTRNADTWNIRLLKADGRIIDRWVSGKQVEAGDAVLVPQKVGIATTWQDNLASLTPLALILNAVK